MLLDFFLLLKFPLGTVKLIDLEKLKRDFNVFIDMPRAVLYCF